MKCIVCDGKLKQTDPRSWDCMDCGAELYRGLDAADIYLSHGCDEDYSFGYAHEELMRASGNS